jgi:hypothetical protein
MPPFTLRFPAEEIGAWAARYDAIADAPLDEAGAFMRREGYLTRAHFLTLARWKSPRSQPRCAGNAAPFVEAVTRTAAAATDEQLRMGVLRLLDGVNWPTASVILHVGVAAPYPPLDVRALWSLGYEAPPAYTFPFWWAYVEHTRALAARQGVDMRTLDRALWQFSKERQ